MPYVIIRSGPRDELAKAVLPSGGLLVEIDRGTTIEDIKKIVQAETNIDPKKQELSYFKRGKYKVMPVSTSDPFVYKHIINYEDREEDPDGHYDKNPSSTAFRIDVKFDGLSPKGNEGALKKSKKSNKRKGKKRKSSKKSKKSKSSKKSKRKSKKKARRRTRRRR